MGHVVRGTGFTFTFALAVQALLALPSRSAEAHIFSTDQVQIFGQGNTGYVTVTDPSGCSALISATVADPTIATIDPPLIDAVTQEFTITAGKPGTTTILFQWSGETAPNPPCPEMSSHQVQVVVTDILPASTANREQSGDVAEPINTATGELYFEEPADLRVKGPVDLVFERYYASFLRRSFIVGVMGDNWRHNFEWDLRNVGNVLVVVNEQGRVARFARMGTINDPWMQVAGQDIPYQVVQAGARFTLLDPRSQRLYIFDVPPGASVIKLVDIEYPGGQRLHLSYSVAGVLQKVDDGLGRALTFTYGAGGRLASVSDGTRQVLFAYGGEELINVTDAAGGITQYEYDQLHPDPALLTRRTLPRGNTPMVNTFDNRGRVATQADAYGNLTTLSYDDATRVTTVTDPLGHVFFHEHDAAGSLVSAQNANGDETTVGNDATGRRESITSAIGGTTAMSYHMASGLVASVTDALGATTTRGIAARAVPGVGLMQHDVMRVDYPDGTFETFTRDGRGLLLSRTDRAGNTWSNTYNARGQVLTRQNPLGGQMIFGYDAAGRLVSETDPAGNVTTYTEDVFGNVTKIAHADGTAREFTWDALGRLLTHKDERGGTTTYVYDPNGNVLSVTDAAGGVWTYTYDDNDRVATITDRAGDTMSYSYDDAGRPIALTGEDGGETGYEYDAAGRLTAVVDRAGARWQVGYDAAGNPTSETDPLGGARQHTLDAAGLVTTVTDAAGGVTRLVYDAMHRVTGVEDFRGAAVTHEYDALGLVAGVVLADGARTTIQHNGLALVEEIVDPNQGTWSFSYDGGGRLVAATDPTGAVTAYTYDARNRPARVTYPGGGTLDFTYDAGGHVIRRLYSDGTDLTYSYDVLGRLTATDGLAVSFDAEGRVVASNGLATPRDGYGRITSVTLAPGVVVTYGYDAAGRLVSVSDSLGGGVTFVRDAAGRPTAIQRQSGASTALSYDAAGRLTGIDDGARAKMVIVRDGAGRVIANERMLPTVFTATPGEETTYGVGPAFTMTGVAYDGLGRVTDDGVRTYTWDLTSRLTGFTEGGATVTFTYDGTGLLLSRSEAGSTRTFVWNRAFDLPVVSVVRQGGADETYYVHAPDGALLYQIAVADGSRRYYHFDDAGNTLFLTDDAGAVVASFGYDPYGAMTSSGDAAGERFTWGGRWGVMREGATGLFRMHARVYDSRTMRFLSRDGTGPHIHPNAVNPYGYAAGDPITRIDPHGYDPAPASPDEPPPSYGEVIADSYGKQGFDLFDDATGLATTATRLEQRVEEAKNVAQFARGTGAADAAQLTRDARFGGWARANKIAGSTPMSAAGHVGTASQIFDVGLEGWKLNRNLGKATEDYTATCARAHQEAEMCSQHGFAMYEQKKFTRMQLQKWLIDCRYDYEMKLLRAQQQWDLDLAANTIASALNMFGSFVPFNPVTFESNKIEVKLPFADKALYEFNY
jgi:RHS repeat-associated protein